MVSRGVSLGRKAVIQLVLEEQHHPRGSGYIMRADLLRYSSIEALVGMLKKINNMLIPNLYMKYGKDVIVYLSSVK